VTEAASLRRWAAEAVAKSRTRPVEARRTREPAGRAARRAELVDPLEDGRWEAFVAHAPSAGVYHHRAWLALLHRAYGYPMTACCVVDASGSICAGAPLALVAGGLRRPRLACLPFADRCPPLPMPDRDAVLAQDLTLALDELRRAMRVRAELRGPVAPNPSARVSARYHGHEIPLEPDVERVVRRIPRGSHILGSAHRAVREGLVVERRTDARALAEFYPLYVATRSREGLPTEPRRFILGLAHLFDRGLGFVALVRDGARPVAGAVFLTFNGALTYRYGAPDAVAVGGRPSTLLLLEGIRWGSGAGLRTLDLGRTELGDERLREAKLSWGVEERVLEYHELGDGAPAPSGRAPAGRAAPLIRRGPAFVSRLVGETLHRHVERT
jgi:Acetyltransferase (GNAT) domain